MTPQADRAQQDFYREVWSRMELADVPGSSGWRTSVPAADFVAFADGLGPRGVTGLALDLGCGGGRHTFVLASYGMFVVGVDFAPEAVALAHIRAASLDVMNRTRFAVGDATALGFAADTFGLVNDDGCLHHLHPLHWPQWANEVLRVARPGGLIRIKVFAASSRIWPGFQPGETPEGGEGPQTRWVVEPSSGGTYFFIEEEVAGLLAGRAELLSLWESPHRHDDAKRFFYAEFLVP